MTLKSLKSPPIDLYFHRKMAEKLGIFLFFLAVAIANGRIIDNEKSFQNEIGKQLCIECPIFSHFI